MYHSSRCIYSSLLLCREYEKLFVELVYEDLVGIYKKTGCLKPCHYMKYRIEGDRQTTSYQSPDFLFSLNSISNDTFVWREEVVYPWTAVVAEFNGSITPFLAVSLCKHVKLVSFSHTEESVIMSDGNQLGLLSS